MYVATAGGGLAPALLTDLEEWWQDASATGAHAGNTLAGSPGATVTGPTGLLAWTPSGAGNTSLTTPLAMRSDVTTGVATFAWVGRLTGGVDNFDCIALFGNSPSPAQVGFQNIGSGRDLRVTNIFDSDIYPDAFPASTWASIVIVMDGRDFEVYVDGVSLGTVSDNLNGTGAQTLDSIFGSSEIDHAIVAVASRAWDSTDVALFHNGGAFLKYADL